MNDDISVQLVQRVQRFKDTTGLTSRQVGKLTGISEQSLCDFLAGRKGLSANSMVHLLSLVNASKAQIEKKLAAPTAPARLAHMQVQGMRLAVPDGGGWLPGRTSDPNDGGDDITKVWKVSGQPVDDELINVLRQIDAIHAEARSAISDFIRKAQKARPNVGGVTDSPRVVRSNEQSKTPGPRPDAFSLQKRLQIERRNRERAEEELTLEKQIKAERKQTLNTQMELAEVRKQTVFD